MIRDMTLGELFNLALDRSVNGWIIAAIGAGTIGVVLAASWNTYDMLKTWGF